MQEVITWFCDWHCPSKNILIQLRTKEMHKKQSKTVVLSPPTPQAVEHLLVLSNNQIIILQHNPRYLPWHPSLSPAKFSNGYAFKSKNGISAFSHNKPVTRFLGISYSDHTGSYFCVNMCKTDNSRPRNTFQP